MYREVANNVVKAGSNWGFSGPISGTVGPTMTHTPELSYEQARAELVSVVERLESGGGSLEESLALWEHGEQLAVSCQRWLDGARARLDAARAAREPSA